MSYEPKRLTDALETLSAELGIPDPTTMSALTRHWPNIVGEQLSQHAKLWSLRDGVLTVAVDDNAWATQLRYMEKTMLEKAREITPKIDAIKTVVKRDF